MQQSFVINPRSDSHQSEDWTMAILWHAPCIWHPGKSPKFAISYQTLQHINNWSPWIRKARSTWDLKPFCLLSVDVTQLVFRSNWNNERNTLVEPFLLYLYYVLMHNCNHFIIWSKWRQVKRHKLKFVFVPKTKMMKISLNSKPINVLSVHE